MPDQAMSPEEVLALYAAEADRLEAALADLPEASLDVSLAAGEWTIRQIVHHLAEGETVWSVYLRMALGAPGSTARLDWYPGNEAWADALDYANRPVEPAVMLFKAQRAYNAQLLRHLSDRWEQHIIVRDQEMTVGAIVGLLAEHAVEHVGEIRKIRENCGT